MEERLRCVRDLGEETVPKRDDTLDPCEGN
jgi:hypothetical protein